MENARFSVFCTGFDDANGYVKYAFHVVHIQSGCAWKVHRRYSEILAMHEQISGSCRSLPNFPPKAISNLSWMWGEDVPVQRVAAFQKYFTELLARQETAQLPSLQCLLGVEVPSPPTSVEVQRWSAHPPTAGTVDVELRVVTDAFSPREPGSSPFAGTIENCKPVEWFVVRKQGAAPSSQPLAYGQPERDEPLLVRALPTGEDLVLEVMATNDVGASEPLLFRLSSPGIRAVAVEPGMRVKAMWAGDNAVYDAVVKALPGDSPDCVLLDWLRPAPLSGEQLTCVCEVGDDTTHRMVPRSQVFLPES
mmetsp:Transcript_27499/g.64093  ORF Transcript_27499/g.64093 Transcript_27499/m.64093 type:complete len:307 (+) Transcript_27499:38-958(+)